MKIEVGKWYEATIGRSRYRVKHIHINEYGKDVFEVYSPFSLEYLCTGHYRISNITPAPTIRKKRVAKHKLTVISHCPDCGHVDKHLLKTDGMSIGYLTKLIDVCCTHKRNIVPCERTVAV